MEGGGELEILCGFGVVYRFLSFISSFRSTFDFIMHNACIEFIHVVVDETTTTDSEWIYIYSHIQFRANSKIAIMMGDNDK